MTEDEYGAYCDYFNSRQYDKVLEYYVPDGEFEMEFFGQKLTKRAEFLKWYEFFHDYVVEEIVCNAWNAGEAMSCGEVIVRVTGKKDLTSEVAAAAGFHVEYPLLKGEVVDSPQFVHYHFREDGKIKAVRAAAFQPAVA